VATQRHSEKHKVAIILLSYHTFHYLAHIICQLILGKPGQSMVPHLRKCSFVAPDIRACATKEIHRKKPHHENPPILGHSISLPQLSIMTGLEQVSHPTAGWSTLATPSPAPSPLLLSAPLLNLEWPLKCSCTLSFVEGPALLSPVMPKRAWDPPLQQEFGEDFCKLLIATCSSWNTAYNPQVCLLVDKWVLGAIVPDCRTLSGPILD